MRKLDRNKLKLGLFGANCSGGLAITTAPERWEASWENNIALARMADAAGLDFMLPLGRWKGYGGITDHNGANFETLTWATGILAGTKNIVAFGTVHVPLFNPVVGTPDEVAAQLTQLNASGIDAFAMGFTNYLDHFPYFRDEVLPRLSDSGLRQYG